MLHLFSNSADTVIANDPEDAVKVWEDATGEDWERDYADSDDWEMIPDEQEMRVNWDTGGESSPEIGVIEDEDANGFVIVATAREWADGMGRCFLCSTEY